MLAAMQGKIHCVQKLIQAGANILMFDSLHGRTCLHYAAYYGHSDCLQAILSAALSTPVSQSWAFARFVNIRDGDGATPLHLAARQRRHDCLHLLLDNGALVSASTGGYGYSGNTPLYYIDRNQMVASKVAAFLILSLSLQFLSVNAQKWVRAGFWYKGSELPIREVNSALFTHLLCGFADVDNSTKARNKVVFHGFTASQFVHVVYGLLRNGLYPLLKIGLHNVMKFMFKKHMLLKQEQDDEKQLMLLESRGGSSSSSSSGGGSSSSSSGGGSSSSRWQYNLPQDIMELILCRLCINDYFRAGTVCMSWCSSVAKVVSEKHCVPKTQLPVLLTFNSMPGQSLSDHIFFNLSENGLVCISHSCHSNLYWRHICGTIEGWLIITDGFLWRPEDSFEDSWFLLGFKEFKVRNNYFYNPISKAKVSLPSQMTLSRFGSDWMFFFRKVVASSVPNNNNNNNKCCNSTLVFAISMYGDLVFCRQGCDDIWTILYLNQNETILYNYLLPPQGYADIAIHGGKLYAVTFNVSFVVVIDLPPPSDSGHHDHRELRLRVLNVYDPRPECHHFTLVQGLVTKGYNLPIYNLVVDFYMGKVLLVMQINDYACYEGHHYDGLRQTKYISAPKPKGFRVFELEESDGNDWVAWREIDDLGDRILFVSAVSSLCVNGSKDESMMRQENRIYFAWDFTSMDSPNLSVRNVGMFSLANGRFKPITPTAQCFENHRSPLWFTPNPW